MPAQVSGHFYCQRQSCPLDSGNPSPRLRSILSTTREFNLVSECSSEFSMRACIGPISDLLDDVGSKLPIVCRLLDIELPVALTSRRAMVVQATINLH
jgi:hypothetical protein